MPKELRRIALMLDLQWPYKRHAGVFAGTQQYANEQGWHSVIDEFAHETLASCQSKLAPYDGIIARANQALAKQTERLRVPVVNVWTNSPVRARLPCVTSDYQEVGRLCAEHLLARGFQNFASVTPSTSYAQELVTKEFARQVGEVGFTCQRESVPQNPNRNVAHWRKTERAVERFLDALRLPVGVYVFSEGIGRLLVQACHRRGWQVPGDVAIIAGQNEVTLCEHPRPSLTSVELGFERVGYSAARMLHQLMDGETPPPPVLITPQGLVVRESTDFIAVNNEQVAAALAFISANSHRAIGQDDVAKAVQVETRTLQNRFSKFLGRPIVAEIRRVRIERAKRELAQGQRLLSDIARDVGFGQTMRMYEVFVRELGVTPSEYRKQRQLEREV